MTGTVMITAGGTGGHVFPGLAVAAKLIARGWRVFWLGTRDGMEGALVRQHGVEFEGVAFGGIRGKGWKTALLGPFALVGAWWQSRRIIRRRAPDVVLGFGGFASVPGALAGLRPRSRWCCTMPMRSPGSPIACSPMSPIAFCWGSRTRCAAGMRTRSNGSAIRWPTRSLACPLRKPGSRAARDRCRSSSSEEASARRRSTAAFPGARAAARCAAARMCASIGRAAHRCVARRLRTRGRRRAMPAVHRRHGVVLRRCRPRALPRRRHHGGGAGRGWRRRDHRAVAGRDRRRAERERASFSSTPARR